MIGYPIKPNLPPLFFYTHNITTSKFVKLAP